MGGSRTFATPRWWSRLLRGRASASPSAPWPGSSPKRKRTRSSRRSPSSRPQRSPKRRAKSPSSRPPRPSSAAKLADVSERRRYLFITGLLAVALVVVGLLAIPGSPIQRKPTLGLDLQGGLEVVLQAVPPENKPGYKIQKSDIDRSVTIMRNRIDKLGVSEPEIRKQGKDQIVIQLAGVHDPRQAAELIGKTAQLQMYDLQGDIADPTKTVQGQPNPQPSLFALLAPVQSQVNGKSTHWYLFDKKKKLVAGPVKSRTELLKGRKVVK